MTSEKKPGLDDALKSLQNYYDYASNSKVREKWLAAYLENLKMYRGEQWDENSDISRDMKDIGATKYTYNNIEPLIDTYVSLQIRSSKRVGYEASTADSNHIRVAENFKQLAYNIQTKNDHVFYSSQKFTAALISGIGWSHFFYENGELNYRFVNPFEVFWDPDDTTPRLNDSSFVGRVRYVPLAKLKIKYPELEHEIDGIIKDTDTEGIDPEDELRETEYLHPDGKWVRGRSVKIVEVYYKKVVDYYETSVLAPDSQNNLNTQQSVIQEHTLKTFSLDTAKKESSGKDIKKLQGTQIWYGVYCDNLLLENGPILEQVPNQQYFPLLPVVYKRDYLGVPYGVVDNLISTQKALNYVWSTTLHYLDAKTIITSDVNSDQEKLRDILKQQMRGKNGVVFIANPKEVQVISHEKDLAYKYELIRQMNTQFENQTGLYDELKGDATNVNTGVGIMARTQNAMNRQNALILAYEHMLISEGKLMLDTVKGIENFKYRFNYPKAGGVVSAEIDKTIALLDFEVYPDTVPNFASSFEEEKTKFVDLMNGQNPSLLLSSPVFLKELGFRENVAYELSNEYWKVLGIQTQAQAMTEQPNIEGGTK